MSNLSEAFEERILAIVRSILPSLPWEEDPRARGLEVRPLNLARLRGAEEPRAIGPTPAKGPQPACPNRQRGGEAGAGDCLIQGGGWTRDYPQRSRRGPPGRRASTSRDM